MMYIRVPLCVCVCLSGRQLCFLFPFTFFFVFLLVLVFAVSAGGVQQANVRSEHEPSVSACGRPHPLTCDCVPASAAHPFFLIYLIPVFRSVLLLLLPSLFYGALFVCARRDCCVPTRPVDGVHAVLRDACSVAHEADSPHTRTRTRTAVRRARVPPAPRQCEHDLRLSLCRVAAWWRVRGAERLRRADAPPP